MRKLLVFSALISSVVLATTAYGSVHIFEEFTDGVLNIISDDSGDFLAVDAAPADDGSGKAGAIGQLDVGDVLATVFQINSFKSPGIKNFGIDWTNETTGVAQIEILTKVATGGINPFTGTAEYDFTFGPAGDPLGLGWAAGTMVALYDDPANNFDLSAFIPSQAWDGTKLWEFGFVGAAGEGWSANDSIDDLTLFAALPALAAGAEFTLGLNQTAPSHPSVSSISFTQIVSPFQVGGAPLEMVDLNGTGEVFNPGATAYPAVDNIDVAFIPNFVPEPTAFVVWMLLCVVAAFRRGMRG